MNDINHKLDNIPLFQHLIAFANTGPQSYHVPGHCNGNIYEQLVTSFPIEHQRYIAALATLAKLDVTELSHTDDLHDPQGIIQQAQQLTANLYGADHSLFLVGGSTAGNVALVLTLCNPGDTIIVQRNVHKSVMNGCKLGEVNAVFLVPELDEETDLAVIPSLAVLEEAIQQHPEAKAVFLTNPNYYGLSVELEPYIQLAHRYNIPLVVDEAHGAHYGIAPYSPNSGLASGADAVVQSAHKTLPALTMGAYLHIQGERIQVNDVQRQLAMLESSSPSYLLMTSLDIARAVLQACGKEMFQQSYQLREQLLQWLERRSSRLAIKQLSPSSKVRQDPYRLLLYDRLKGASGAQLQNMLEQQGIWVEMSVSHYAVLVWHMAMNDDQLQQLQQGIIQVEQQLNQKLLDDTNADDVSSNPNMRQSKSINAKLAVSAPVQFKRKIQLDTTFLELDQAEGCCCAEQVIPYPPGIPILFEGELITDEHIAEIRRYMANDTRFQGAGRLNQGMIKVFVQ